MLEYRVPIICGLLIGGIFQVSKLVHDSTSVSDGYPDLFPRGHLSTIYSLLTCHRPNTDLNCGICRYTVLSHLVLQLSLTTKYSPSCSSYLRVLQPSRHKVREKKTRNQRLTEGTTYLVQRVLDSEVLLGKFYWAGRNHAAEKRTG